MCGKCGVWKMRSVENKKYERIFKIKESDVGYLKAENL